MTRRINAGRTMYVVILLLFLLFAVLFLIFQQVREREFKVAMIDGHLQDYNIMLERGMRRVGMDEASLDSLVECIGDGMTRVTLMDTVGRVFYDNMVKDYGRIANHSDRKEFQDALQAGRGHYVGRISRTTGLEYFYSATYFPEEGLVIRTALPYDKDLAVSLESDRHFLWISLLIIALLTIVLTAFMHYMDYSIMRLNDEEHRGMRQQLTQNVAHELKTPVASIQGYLDTVLDNASMDEETKEQFLRRCQSQSRRLSALLQDISTLNRMDNASSLNRSEDVDVSALVANMVQETQQQLDAKGMTFHNELPFGVHVEGDPGMIYSIFRNLTDNAIAYAGQGTRIELAAVPSADSWRFTFSDNGVGVSEEHLPHLFERFYRVDKGRDRKMGGTGLGLAIVKNAVLLHGGRISVASNHGLRFDFTLRTKLVTKT